MSDDLAAPLPPEPPTSTGGTRPIWPLPADVNEDKLRHLRHDLRTPLNQIIGFTEMLIENSAEGASNSLIEDLQRLLAAGNQILALLSDGLAPWKLASGDLDLNTLRRSLLGQLNSLVGHREACETTARALALSETVSDLQKIATSARHLRRLLADDQQAEELAHGAPLATSVSAPPFPGAGTRFPFGTDAMAPALHGRVLVVDDDSTNREMLVRRLVRMGLTTADAADGQAALDRLGREAFDLVLLDIIMPVLDGFQTLERLKADDKLRHIPVIMLTALDEVSATVRGIEAGAEDYVPKPFNPVILRARIGASLEKKRLRDQERAHLAELQAERATSERLLLNVLPKAIGARLKAGEKTIVDAVPEATVLFADIVNFTRIAAESSPAHMVKLLNELFSDFDVLVEGMQVEKVKTIGDAYMVVGGLPQPTPEHAIRCADMALAMLNVVAMFNRRTGQRWQIRIGMHSGPLVAGIIGSKKFAYDLWGDTVNIASRLESHGEAGVVQVSQATVDRLRDLFVLEPRGPVELKHRGEIMAYRLLRWREPRTAPPA